VVTNTHATIEELLDASFSMWPVTYQGKYAISSSQNFLLVVKSSTICTVAPFYTFCYCLMFSKEAVKLLLQIYVA
jgi:hypothetical protein